MHLTNNTKFSKILTRNFTTEKGAIVLATLGWIGCGVVYLSLGYIIGEIANAEYFNNTATGKLGFFGKIIRVLLFPVAYHEWENRFEMYRKEHSSPPSSLLRCWANAFSEDSDEKAKQRYCRIVMISWPPKIILALAGFAQIAFFIFLSILKAITFCIELPFVGMGKLKNYLKSRGTNGARFADATLEELERFKIQELVPNKEQLVDAKINLENRVNALKEKIKEGGELLLALTNHKDSFAHKRCALLVQKLQIICDKESGKLGEVQGILSLIQSKESELDDIVKLNRFYQAVGELEVDTGKDNQIVMQATLAAMEICRGFFKQAYALETDMMCKADMPLDDIVEQMHESDKKEESLSQIASNVIPISRK